MVVLGSTGSIGVNTLNIARKYNINIEALVAGKNIELLNKQIAEFAPKVVVISDKDDVSKVNHKNVKYGEDAIIDVIVSSKSELIVNSLVGFLGLRPTIEAIKHNKRVALANKESLVVAGKFIDKSYLSPIDSEHFALWYLLNGRPIDKMTITASGGSFRDTPLHQLQNATVADALNHPNWSMGKKITIDSATMMNKLFELIEGKWLFDCDNIDAIIETKSMIHAVVDFVDGSSTAHIANTDMQLPIAFAINGKVEEKILPSVNLLEVGSLEFREITTDRYPIWQIKDEVLKRTDMGVVINASNEIAIEKFFAGEINYLDISKHILDAYKRFDNLRVNSIDEIFEIDKEVREYTQSL
jgi:1-deoxy-D-xylulose-5-phosphate reductoisomerase